MDELTDRAKQLKEFLADNDIKKAIGNGGQDLINSIDAYKEKLKELAPYNYEAYVMQMEEKASHEERLKYLRKQLELLKEANVISTHKSDRFIEKFGSSFEDIAKLPKFYTATGDEKNVHRLPWLSAMLFTPRELKEAEETFNKVAEDIIKEFPDIATNPKTQ